LLLWIFADFLDSVVWCLLKVDLFFAGHKHNYERTLPVIGGKVQNNGSYNSPNAPVYVVNGAAGNREHLGGFFHSKPDWSVTRLKTHGWGLLDATRDTLTWRFFNETDVVLDSFKITK
jgi:acid phosphatase type 7